MASNIFILLIIIIAHVQVAFGVVSVYKGGDCQTCLDDKDTYAAVCRAKGNSKISYCCTADETTKDKRCNSRAPLCTSSIAKEDMWGLVCPNEKYPCGIARPEFTLKPGQTMTVKIGNKFGPNNRCYYTFKPSEYQQFNKIPRTNLRWMQVLFKKLDNMEGYISNSTSETAIEYVTPVAGQDYNFTMANWQNYYVTVNPQVGGLRGRMLGEIVFRFYDYDPMCAEMTYWNGYRCRGNYTMYCASLKEKKTEEFYKKAKQKFGDDVNLTKYEVDVVYERKKCVVKVTTTEINKKIEYIEKEAVPEIIYEEISQL